MIRASKVSKNIKNIEDLCIGVQGDYIYINKAAWHIEIKRENISKQLKNKIDSFFPNCPFEDGKAYVTTRAKGEYMEGYNNIQSMLDTIGRLKSYDKEGTVERTGLSWTSDKSCMEIFTNDEVENFIYINKEFTEMIDWEANFTATGYGEFGPIVLKSTEERALLMPIRVPEPNKFLRKPGEIEWDKERIESKMEPDLAIPF